MSETEQKILGLLHNTTTMPVELIVLLLPEFSWNEVFLALKRLANRHIISHNQDGSCIEIWYMAIASSPLSKQNEQSVRENGQSSTEMMEFQKVG